MSDPTVKAIPGTPIASGALVTPGGGQGYTGSQGPVGPSGSPSWTSITGRPPTFPPSPHTHVEADVTNLVADLNNRVLTSNIVQGSQSLTGGGTLTSSTLTLTLVNDAASPGAGRFYATDLSGVRGWIPYGTAASVSVPASGNATNAQAVLGSDTRLADTRSPKTHAASHGSGGSDQVSLLRAQISDLPGVVNTASMGFAPQLPTVNPTTVYFRGDGSYASVTVNTSGLQIPWSAIINPPLSTVGAPGLLRQLNPITPIPGSGSQTQVWCRGDDTWQTLPVTTYTSAAFNIPVVGASTPVTVNPSPEWPQVTSCIYFSDGVTRGFLECSATGIGPYASVTLTNRGFFLNAAPGATVNSGAILSLRGPSVSGGSLSGLVPTLPASTPTFRFLDGTGAFNTIPLATNASSGAMPILSNNAAQYLNGLGAWNAITYSSLTGIPPSFVPSVHAPSHKSGGADVIALDTLGATTDITTLNASTSAHGLLQKLPGGTTTFLRADGAFTAPPPPAAGAPASPGILPTTDVQTFAAPGAFTWTKPTVGTPSSVDIICIGGGGGGGGGAYVAAATAAGGGGGGGGASYSRITIPASLLGTTVSGSVGAGGTGGVAVSVSGTAGNNGQVYATTNDSWFGSNSPAGANICYADGGRPGAGGAVGGAAGTAGTGGVKGQYAGTAGGAGSASGAAAGAATAPTSISGAGGGGGGGGFSTGNAEVTGALGATYPTWLGGTGAGTAGLVHAAGGPGSAAPLNAYLPGAGGGGGGSSNTAATRGGIGGLAGNYGGGGGGGGAGDASANAVGAGAGGNGANGYVLIITYF